MARLPVLATELRLSLLAAAAGMLVGIVGAAFLTAIDLGWKAFRRLVAPGGWWEAFAEAHLLPVPAWAFGAVSAALLVVVATAMTRRFAPEAASGGTKEVVAVVEGRRPPVRWGCVLPVKFVGALLGISAGAVIGPEGPCIHMGGAIGTMVHRAARQRAEHGGVLLVAGAGAGMSVAFSAPLGGSLFVIEELRRGQPYSLIGIQAVLSASVAAVITAAALLGRGAGLPMPVPAVPGAMELALVVPLAIVIGAFGVILNALMVVAVDLSHLVARHHWMLPPLLVGACAGVFTALWPDAAGTGSGLAVALAQAPPAAGMVLALLAVRTLLFVAGYSCGVPAGVYAPQLALGALLGVGYALIVGALLPASADSAATFALVGIVALLTATGHAPLTSIVLVVEATQAVGLLPAMMAAAAVANVTAVLMNGRPLQRLLLERTLRLLPLHHHSSGPQAPPGC